MKLIDFVNEQYTDLSNFSLEELYKAYNNHTLYLPNATFKSIDDMDKYNMRDGDVVTLYQCIKRYKENNTINIQNLRNNVKNIYGLSERVIDNIEGKLGKVFKTDSLQGKSKDISGLGDKTLKNIIEYIKKD